MVEPSGGPLLVRLRRAESVEVEAPRLLRRGRAGVAGLDGGEQPQLFALRSGSTGRHFRTLDAAAAVLVTVAHSLARSLLCGATRGSGGGGWELRGRGVVEQTN